MKYLTILLLVILASSLLSCSVFPEHLVCGIEQTLPVQVDDGSYKPGFVLYCGKSDNFNFEKIEKPVERKNL